MKYKVKRKKKTIKVSYICLILIVILVLMSTSYSLWQTNLYINGTVTGEYTEPELPVDIVRPSEDRLTTNTSLRGGILDAYEIFTFQEDIQENNTVTTEIVNGQKVIFVQNTIDVTFSLTLQNTSGSTFTDPTIEIEEYDPSERMNPTSTDVNGVLSATVVENGESVTLSVEIEFEARRDVTVGSYVNYKIGFLCDGIRRYYNYRILISG